MGSASGGFTAFFDQLWDYLGAERFERALAESGPDQRVDRGVGSRRRVKARLAAHRFQSVPWCLRRKRVREKWTP